MSDEILLQFLEAGIVNVGSDDSKLEKLRATAKDLATALKKNPSNTICWTLIAVDPEAAADDPVIVESWAILKKNWATVSNTYQSIPVALLRAMLLDALVQSAPTDDSIAIAFANVARNMLPHMPLGTEGPVWQSAVAEVEDQVDTRAETEWMTPDLIHVHPMAYQPPESIKFGSSIKVAHRETLAAKILAAAGPNGATNPNPHWPNQPQLWAQEFSGRMAEAVADAVDSVAKANQMEPIDLAPSLKALSSSVEEHVAKALQSFSGATAGLQRRTNLLWWKEALYSASSRTSYRRMEPFTAASLMALDLFEQVPLFSPASVSAFLHEAILILPGASAGEPLPVSKILHRLFDDPLIAVVQELARKLDLTRNGRRPLLAVLGDINHDPLTSVAFRQMTGLDEQVEMRPDEWGSHLFREMQAARATHAGAGKRPRNKS